jgi:hypothetical protein
MDYKRKRRHATKLPYYQVAEIKPLGQNLEIEAYLRSCGVWTAAKYRLEEVYYYVQDDNGKQKHFSAAGWLNELGHWQVTAPNFTGCLSHAALTIFPGAASEAWLFDTIFDFLRHPEYKSTNAQIIIINHRKLLQAGLAKARTFSSIRTFFNNPLPDI